MAQAQDTTPAGFGGLPAGSPVEQLAVEIFATTFALPVSGAVWLAQRQIDQVMAYAADYDAAPRWPVQVEERKAAA